ncbi:MAG: ABC transporter substrate-binding protein [Thaumarchaeota archaeon]|nr:ABC transporter substrate-binding protein [Nitrososphaerota archaeon]MBI3642384.1 ABC transporter substrate-binding protein [Nitrososphaerota archaeon]
MTPKIKFGIAVGIILIVIAINFVSPVSITDRSNFTDTISINVTKTVRIGYFPNINHAQAVIGLGNGDFQKELRDIKVETQVFNAGPSAIEALFANRVDVTYVGSNPAINGYIKSDGQGLRIIAGAASGGAVFVVRNDAGINSAADFAGKKFASPQIGNTQDVALRSYLLKNGYKTTENGGNVTVVPANNPDIVTLFLKKSIDGAWVPEPWGAKLVKEANGRILVDERDLWPNGKFVTSQIVVRTDYLKNHPDVIKKLLEAHVDETTWINNNKDQAAQVFNAQLEKLTGKTIPVDELQNAFSRLEITYDPVKESLYKSANNAFDLGFLGDKKPDLSNIYDLTLLNEVLNEKKLLTVS